MTHDAAATTPAYRTLSTPETRLPLAACLNTAASYKDKDMLTAVVHQGVAAHGLDMKTLSRLTVAWPQKHPDSGHENAATAHASLLVDALRAIFPDKQILRADALYETVRLNRSENACMLHTLTGRQRFAVDPALQTEPLPFLTDDGAQGEVFILTDWLAMQGTTLAALASYITHNGGHVAAVALPYEGKPLRQKTEYGVHPDPALPRQGQIQPLATAFRAAAMGNGNYTGAECVSLFNRALQPHGLSLETLTHGEALSLCAEMLSRYTNFSTFVEKLGLSQMAQHDHVHALRRSGGPR